MSYAMATESGTQYVEDQTVKDGVLVNVAEDGTLWAIVNDQFVPYEPTMGPSSSVEKINIADYAASEPEVLPDASISSMTEDEYVPAPQVPEPLGAGSTDPANVGAQPQQVTPEPQPLDPDGVPSPAPADPAPALSVDEKLAQVGGDIDAALAKWPGDPELLDAQAKIEELVALEIAATGAKADDPAFIPNSGGDE